MGRGRGRGRGLAAVSYSRGLQLPPALETSASEIDTQTETATESEATPEEKRMRDIRKLKKMLRQVRGIAIAFTLSTDNQISVIACFKPKFNVSFSDKKLMNRSFFFLKWAFLELNLCYIVYYVIMFPLPCLCGAAS